MKFLGLIWEKKAVKIFLFLAALIALAVKYLSISPATEGYLISVIITLVVVAAVQAIEALSLYRRFKNIEGSYSTYSYKTDDYEKRNKKEYDQLEKKSNGVATISYDGGNEFTIQHRTKEGRYQWDGQIEFQAKNIAYLACWYVKPSSLRDVCSYKRLIVREDIKPIRIYMFSEDTQRFGREVLIKSEGRQRLGGF